METTLYIQATLSHPVDIHDLQRITELMMTFLASNAEELKMTKLIVTDTKPAQGECAAPELLEALQSYVDSMLEKDQQEKWFNQYKDDAQANRVLYAAISAIKKATNK